MSSSRRELLASLRNAITSPSEQQKDVVSQGADLVSEQGAELAVLLLAIDAALKMGKDKIVTVSATPTEVASPALQESVHGTLETLERSLPEAIRTIQTLENRWREEYLKEETYVTTETVTECTGIGQDRACVNKIVTTTKKRPVWKEPAQFTALGINYQSIPSWKAQLQHLQTIVDRLQSGISQAPTFRWKTESYNITETPVDTQSQNLARTLGFAGSGLAFAFYEELISLYLAQKGVPNEEQLSSQGIKRRSFFKLVGGLFGISQIQRMHDSLLRSNTNLSGQVRQEAERVLAQKDVDAVESFRRFFGTSVETLMQQLEATASLAASGSAVSWENQSILSLLGSVGNHFQTVMQDAREALHIRSESRFEYAIPQDLVTIMNNTWAHERITAFAAGKTSEANFSAIAEVFTLIALFAGIGMTSEVIVAATNGVLDRLTS